MEPSLPPTHEPSLHHLGEESVESAVVCNLTRFALRHPLHLLAMYREYRRVLRQARQGDLPGLLHAAFALELPAACYVISFWRSAADVAHFGSQVPRHVTAGNSVLPRLRFERGDMALWSAKWRLVSVSKNLNWPGWDLRDAIREEAAALGREVGGATRPSPPARRAHPREIRT